MDIRRIGSGIVAVTTLGVGMAVAQTTRAPARAAPSTRPAATSPATSATSPTSRPANVREMSADQVLGQMLRPPQPASGGPRVLQPLNTAPLPDRTTGPYAVQPGAPLVAVLREGTFLPERTGRLTRSPDGTQAEFTFDADGRALRDPPLVILPSLKLVAMENAVSGSNRDLKFRVSGTITEYRGRNYILLEKVVVIPEAGQQF